MAWGAPYLPGKSHLVHETPSLPHPSGSRFVNWRNKAAKLRGWLRNANNARYSLIEQVAELEADIKRAWSESEAAEKRTNGWKEVAKLAQGENRRLINLLASQPNLVEEASRTIAEHSSLVAVELAEVESRWKRCEDQRFAAVEQVQMLEEQNTQLTEELKESRETITGLEGHRDRLLTGIEEFNLKTMKMQLDRDACRHEVERLTEENGRIRKSNEALAIDLEHYQEQLRIKKEAAVAQLLCVEEAIAEIKAKYAKQEEHANNQVRRACHVKNCFHRGMRIMQNRIDRLEGDLTMAEESANAWENAYALAKVDDAMTEAPRFSGVTESAHLLDETDEPENTEPMGFALNANEFNGLICAGCGRKQEPDEGFIGQNDGGVMCFGCDQARQDGCEAIGDPPEMVYYEQFDDGGCQVHLTRTGAGIDWATGEESVIVQYLRLDIHDRAISQRDQQITQLASRVDELVAQVSRSNWPQAVGSAVQSGSAYVRGGALRRGTLTRGAKKSESTDKTSVSKRFGRVVPKDGLPDTNGKSSIGNAVTREPFEDACQKGAIRLESQAPERATSRWVDKVLDGVSSACGLSRTQSLALRILAKRPAGGSK